MKRIVSRMLLAVATGSLVFAFAGQPGMAQDKDAAKPVTPKKAAPRRRAKSAEAAAQSQWLQITVVRVKADMATEYQEFVKNESIPNLKKGGIKERTAWTTGVFGEAFEYVYVTPIENFAQYDGPGPFVKALGEEGARAYNAKARRFIISSHTYGVRTLPDLSLAPKMTGEPKLAVINSIHIAPGKSLAFESLVKSDVLPAVKKAGAAGYLVTRTDFGGDPNEYVSLTLLDSFAEIGKGSPLVRGMGGQAAFNRFLLKVAGIIAHQERTVARYVADLSFGGPAK